MKKFFLSSLFILTLSCFSFGQVLVHISGHVYSNSTNTGVANHQVIIFADSSVAPYFGYSNTVTTNSAGYYVAEIPITGPSAQIVFHLSTIDCNGSILTYPVVSSPTNYYLSHDFYVNCGPNPSQCEAAFVYTPCANTTGLCYHFISTSTPAGSSFQYVWSFGDNTAIATTGDPHHTFAQPGTYQVCLTISTSAGCVDTVCQSVVVPPVTTPCEADFTITQSPNNPLLYNFHSTSVGAPASNQFWYFSNGATATGLNTSYTFQPGTYTICLTIHNPTTACFDSICKTVVVAGNPTPCDAAFTVTPCQNTPGYCFNFHAVTPFSSNQFFWTFGDGTTAQLPFVSHSFQSPGNYNVCLVVFNPAANCADTVCHTITVGSMPCNANFVVMPCSTPNICFHFIPLINDSTMQYFWSFGDGGTSTTAVTTYNYNQPGIYTVCLTVIGANGCIDSTCQIVPAGQNPGYDLYGHVEAGNNLLDHGKVRLFRINSNAAAQLYATALVDSAGYYHFSGIPAGTYYIKARPTPASQYFNQFLPTYYPHNVHWVTATAVAIPPVNNPYNISLRPVSTPFAGPGNISGIITQGFKMSGSGAPAPDEEIILEPVSGDPYVCATSNANGEFSFTNLGYGTYKVYAEVAGIATIPAQVSLSASNPSANNLSLVITTTQVVTDVNTLPAEAFQIGLFPNPASSSLRLDIISGFNTEATLTICDLPGRIIESGTLLLTNGASQTDLDLSRFGNGSYILTLKTIRGIFVRKFVVAK